MYKNIVFRQWIVYDPEKLRRDVSEDRHPLPNTYQKYSHRQTLLDSALADKEALHCLFYLGDTLAKNKKRAWKA
ncbi:hypothetical protein [Wolbachia endosymbiont of Pentidionis agamae]|uniref:hypothetical protein n=1 Tax=Wolbachia endosymbiont of Pentidionis agamae TaxID=3110435 RepID=UPI002FCFE6DA